MKMLIIIAVFLYSLGCKQPQQLAPKGTPIVEALEKRARDSENNLCGDIAAKELRRVAQILKQNGVGSIDGECYAFCAFIKPSLPEDPTSTGEVFVFAVASVDFSYDGLEILNEHQDVVGLTRPDPTRESIVKAEKKVQWLAARFFVLEPHEGKVQPTSRPFVQGEPIVSLSVPVNQKLSVRFVGKANKSNSVPLLNQLTSPSTHPHK